MSAKNDLRRMVESGEITREQAIEILQNRLGRRNEPAIQPVAVHVPHIPIEEGPSGKLNVTGITTLKPTKDVVKGIKDNLDKEPGIRVTSIEKLDKDKVFERIRLNLEQQGVVTPQKALNSLNGKVEHILTRIVEKHPVKAVLNFGCEFRKITTDPREGIKIANVHINTSKHSSAMIINNIEDVHLRVFELLSQLANTIDIEQMYESGFSYSSATSLDIKTSAYAPLASSYIDLSYELSATGCILNIQNKSDNKCALWCIFFISIPNINTSRKSIKL